MSSLCITVVGLLNKDLVVYCARAPAAGETLAASAFETHNGGKGLNEAVAAGRLAAASTRVRMVGSVGLDPFGRELVACLDSAGVVTDEVRVVPGPSGVALITVEENGENRIVVHAGANAATRPGRIEWPGRLVVVTQNEIPSPELVMGGGGTVVYNPLPWQDDSVEAMRLADVVVVNEGEAAAAARVLGVAAGARAIAQEVGGYVVVTKGAEGVEVAEQDCEADVHVPAVQVDPALVVDTTGAGDTFLGAVAVVLAEGGGVVQGVEFGVRAAALAIQRKGAADGIPHRRDLE